jgi:UDP-2-acetamido-3-amino-2,3-dideoxy-glucuronate N-acetyltransferase
MRTRQLELEGFEGRVRFVQLREVDEPRGKLIEIDYAALPFAPCRSFIVGDVPNGSIRGGHAHEKCEQLLICLQGQLHIEVLFKRQRAEITLNDKAVSLYIGARVWARQTYFENATLLVLASLPYDLASYIDEPEQI